MKYVVTVNGEKFEVEVEQMTGERMPTEQQPKTTGNAASDNTVKAPSAGKLSLSSPMPGTILAVKAEKGQQVKRGQIIFVLEAMKMENEIVAPEDGVLADIMVVKGAQVNAGDVLAVYE